VQAVFLNGSDSSASGEDGPLQGSGPLSIMILSACAAGAAARCLRAVYGATVCFHGGDPNDRPACCALLPASGLEIVRLGEVRQPGAAVGSAWLSPRKLTAGGGRFGLGRLGLAAMMRRCRRDSHHVCCLLIRGGRWACLAGPRARRQVAQHRRPDGGPGA
jgi:hypothetical protein